MIWTQCDSFKTYTLHSELHSHSFQGNLCNIQPQHSCRSNCPCVLLILHNNAYIMKMPSSSRKVQLVCQISFCQINGIPQVLTMNNFAFNFSSRFRTYALVSVIVIKPWKTPEETRTLHSVELNHYIFAWRICVCMHVYARFFKWCKHANKNINQQWISPEGDFCPEGLCPGWF